MALPIRLYHPIFDADVEDVEEYRPGGFYPTHVGDTIAKGRYKILHKLGSGGFSTIWLARDTVDKTYCAVKILRAEEKAPTELRWLAVLQSSQNPMVRHVRGLPGGFWSIVGASKVVPPAILRALQRVAPPQPDPLKTVHIRGVDRHFLIQGPNGRHNCLAMEVAGPSLDLLYNVPEHGYIAGSRRLRADLAHRVMRQVVEAVHFLHSHELCHGGNFASVSFSILPCTWLTLHFTDLTTANVLLAMKPMDDWTEDDVYARLGSPDTIDVWPVRGTSLRGFEPAHLVRPAGIVGAEYLTGDAFLVDFGKTFPFAEPPKPDEIGIPYAYRAPETMFDSRMCPASDVWSLACVLYEIRAGDAMFFAMFGGKIEIIEQMLGLKGKLPDHWWAKWDEKSVRVDEDGKFWKDYPDGRSADLNTSIEERIASIGVEDDETAMFGSEVAILEALHTKVSEEEAVLMKDFLERALMWEPEERMSVAEMLQHPWIAGDFSQTGASNPDH